MELYSRVERIGGPNGYRDIAIHEMTEAEIRFLKEGRWFLLLIGLTAGFAAGALFVLLTGPYPHWQ